MEIAASVAIIGAGCSGLTAIKNCLQAGINQVVCFEKGDQLGGNWVFTAAESHSSVCETTHIISSKKLSEYIDFPMPDHYPDYPSHRQVLEYFQAYARHFELAPYIRFNTAVEAAKPLPDGRWTLHLSDGSQQVFDYLMVANGHHSAPKLPQFKGHFTGKIQHSHSFKNNQTYAGQRVLVVGAGNSGCDCAVEISRVADRVAISMRRPYYIIPKFMMGRPTDTYNKLLVKLPQFLRKRLQRLSLWLQVGNYEDYGLQTPDYPITRCHPTLNTELLYKIRHGKVQPRRGIERVDGQQVHFEDGTVEEFDVIMAATGYEINFPFFNKDLIDYSDAERIPLYLRMIHPDFKRLFFIGLVQPQGCVWPISDHQAKLAASHIAGRWPLPTDLRRRAEAEADDIARQFITSKRHRLEIHYHPFIAQLQKLIPPQAPEWPQPKATQHPKIA